MSYTHYLSFSKAPRGQAEIMEKRYKRAIRECSKVIFEYSQEFGGLSGFSAHARPGRYGGLKVNGSDRVGSCEALELPEHFNQLPLQGEFVKTNRLPYDTVITACLIILKHRLGDTIALFSDGKRDDWNDGLILAKKVLGLNRIAIPDSIKVNEKQKAS